MNFEEMNYEVLECARYGEDDDLKALLQAGADVNYVDDGGTSAMHKASANGETACMKILLEFGALYKPNKQGNTPAHWAAQNGKLEALKLLIEGYKDVMDVLQKNEQGRSILTEAFQSKNADCIEICLSHESASEERLLDTKGADIVESNSKVPADKGDKDDNESEMNIEEGIDAEGDALNVANAVTHKMSFPTSAAASTGSAPKPVLIRELPVTRADNPFGTEVAPQDDTTGLCVWPASILLSQWVAEQYASQKMSSSDKIFLELGAGCGLPGIVAAVTCQPKTVYITDIHVPTLENCAHNVRMNGTDCDSTDPKNLAECIVSHEADGSDGSTGSTGSTAGTSGTFSTKVIVQNMNWMDPTSFPPEQADIILGSDLVYDSNILAVLVPAVCAVLAPGGSLLYAAPNTGRAGMEQLEEALSRVNIECVEKFPAPTAYYANPLLDVDSDEFVLHFYDLSTQQPHTLYRFQWRADTAVLNIPAAGSVAGTGDGAMEVEKD